MTKSSPRKKPPLQAGKFDPTHTTHGQEPDYTKPLFNLNPETLRKMQDRLEFLYGLNASYKYITELERIIRVYYAHKPEAMIRGQKNLDPAERFTEMDLILITYGDLIYGDAHSPLAALAEFCDTCLAGSVNTLHILPFFPYSSDRGFAITDFTSVDPNLGTWADIEDLEGRYQLMFDGVINHVSSKNEWFGEFLNGNPSYKDFFTHFQSPDDLTEEQRSLIVRPRTSDILTRFESINGPVWVWTTFSPDQVDLNFGNPKVLMKIIEVLLFYVRRGADIIRLDAVTYLWDEPGTPSIHLDQSHEIVKLLRDVLDAAAPGVALITETNVPHEENISYFGNGRDEAQMVYNFALPPLVLYSFYKQDAAALTKWASSLKKISDTTTYFNFLDSHDGIGLMGVMDILSEPERDFLIQRAIEHGALISYKTGKDGRDEPYEINTTWYSALNYEDTQDDTEDNKVKRFLSSRSVALALRGVPGIYLHGLIGTTNDFESILTTDSKRAINRTVIDQHALMQALNDPNSKASHINRKLGVLMNIRTTRKAFHPNGGQKVLSLSSALFSVLRISSDKAERILCLANVTDKTVDVQVSLSDLDTEETHWRDLILDNPVYAQTASLAVTLKAYDVVWLSTEID